MRPKTVYAPSIARVALGWTWESTMGTNVSRKYGSNVTFVE